MSNFSLQEFTKEVLAEAVRCWICGDPTYDDSDTCELHKGEPTKLELLPADIAAFPGRGLPVHRHPAPINGRPRHNALRSV